MTTLGASSVSRRYSVSLGGRVVGALAQTAVIALLARSFTTHQFATYAVMFSIGQVAVVMLELGFTTRVLRLKIEPDPRGVIGALLVSRVLLVGVIGVVTTISAWQAPNAAGVLWAVALYVSGEACGDLAVAVLQGELRSVTAISVLVARRLLALVPFLLGLTPTAAISALVLAGVAGWSVFLVVAVRRAGRPVPLRSLVGTNGPLGLTTAATGLTQADTAVVSAVAGATLIASYAAASRLSNPVNLAIATLLQVVIPEFATLEPQARYQSFVRTRRIVVVLGSMVAASAVLAPAIINTLYGPGFTLAAPVLAGVLIGAGISAFSQIHLAWLVVEGLTMRLPLQLLAVVLGGLVVLLGAVHAFGSPGAAGAIVLLQMLIAVVILLQWRRSTLALRTSIAASR